LKIVCNTSPLILLAKIHRLDTLIRLYSELMIPKAVEDEIGTKPGKENGSSGRSGDVDQRSFLPPDFERIRRIVKHFLTFPPGGKISPPCPQCLERSGWFIFFSPPRWNGIKRFHWAGGVTERTEKFSFYPPGKR
jgi:hypothetical protein